MKTESLIQSVAVAVISGVIVYFLTRPKDESATRVVTVAGLRG